MKRDKKEKKINCESALLKKCAIQRPSNFKDLGQHLLSITESLADALQIKTTS
jgi:hypothetical protein